MNENFKSILTQQIQDRCQAMKDARDSTECNWLIAINKKIRQKAPNTERKAINCEYINNRPSPSRDFAHIMPFRQTK